MRRHRASTNIPRRDGHVAYSLANFPRLVTYDLRREHGELPDAIEPLLEILSTGTASGLEAQPRSTAAVLDSARLGLREEAVFFPGERDLLNAALGRPAPGRRKGPDSVLRVRVTHGHLREARYPVVVGHYVGDAIVSAEAQLDQRLDQRLSTRFYMQTYAGPLGTVEIVRVPKAQPPGAIVIGLGEVGELTSEMLRRSALEACLHYALARAEDSAEPSKVSATSTVGAGSVPTVSPGSFPSKKPRSAAISSILIGVSGGSFLSVLDSVTAITRAAVEANRMLSHRRLPEKVSIDEIEFIEDTAIEAAHAVASLRESLEPDLQPGERLDLITNLQSAPGGRFRRPLDIYSTGWWRRIQITRKESAQDCVAKQGSTAPLPAALPAGTAAAPLSTDSEDECTRLVFAALTDRARIPETIAVSQTKIANVLIADSISRTDYDKDAAVALYELLVPNPFKDQAQQAADLVLMLDAAAAQYPWELMSDRMREQGDPMAVKSGMIRQFKTGNYERISGPRGTRAHAALVIGDTMSSLPELPGAQNEARRVAGLLKSCGYSAEPALIKQSASVIIRKLFANEYRILHLAGHGIFTAGCPERTGMVLTDGIYLSPLEFEQLRNLPELVFINCCHLGVFNNGRRVHTKDPGALAASVAQTLIQKVVKAVIAAGWAVDDSAAVAFATKFYSCLLEGRKFGEAVKQARQEAYRASATNTWGAYQCYGNPDFSLDLQPRDSGSRSAVFYSRRENIEELRDISADARGSNSSEHQIQLLNRTVEIDRQLPSQWRDGEVLSLLGDAYRQLGRLTEAIKTLKEALAKPKAEANIEAIEQLANCLDRRAKQLLATDPPGAEKMWQDAQTMLLNLNTTIGESHERLSLLGGLCKRRGSAKSNPEERKPDFERSCEFYRRAYETNQLTCNEVNLYSGVNWMTMAYLSGSPVDEALKKASAECLARVLQKTDQPNFWDRVSASDALLVDNLLKRTLREHLDDLEKLYTDAFGFGTPVEIDSVVSQVRFIQTMSPNDAVAELLRRIDLKAEKT
jgi:CHAT domain-containing protein